MKNLNLLFISLFFILLSCSKEDEITQPQETQGYNMLLIGNSFFKPYANNLNEVALDAGFEEHNATLVFRGGNNGRPINFWNDSDSNAHQEIKTTLDQGNIDYFGMTAGYDLDNTDDPFEGQREWINYALQNNPNIKIFIAIPVVDYPAYWDERAEEFGFDTIEELYDYFVNILVNQTMINQLRTEFPSTTIFTIPTGWSTIKLAKMNLDNELLDTITIFGPKPTSLFTDQKGHQGQIAIEAGTLVWLNSIYNIDLTTNTYETGFNTDLHDIAKQVTDSHDSNYKQ